MKRKNRNVNILLACFFVLSAGCENKNQIEKSSLTPGMAKTKIINGVTTESDILNVFGSPNIIAKNKTGNEVWTYDKVAMEQSGEDTYWNIIIAGKGKEKQTTSTRTFTLMIEFDDKGIVKDHSYRASQF
jgi:hypothetical protein